MEFKVNVGGVIIPFLRDSQRLSAYLTKAFGTTDLEVTKLKKALGITRIDTPTPVISGIYLNVLLQELGSNLNCESLKEYHRLLGIVEILDSGDLGHSDIPEQYLNPRIEYIESEQEINDVLLASGYIMSEREELESSKSSSEMDEFEESHVTSELSEPAKQSKTSELIESAESGNSKSEDTLDQFKSIDLSRMSFDEKTKLLLSLGFSKTVFGYLRDLSNSADMT